MIARTLALTGMADLFDAMRKESRNRPEDLSGLALMVASALCFTLMAVFIKLFLSNAPSQSVVFTRAVAMTLVFSCMALSQGVPLAGKRPTRLILRGLLGYGAVSCYFWSVNHVGIADAVLLQYSHPIFVAMLAPWLLRETTGRWHWLLVFVAFVGIAFVLKSSGAAGGSIRTEALVGLTGSLLSGLAYITIRNLSKSEHPLTILVWFPAVMIPGSLAGVIAMGADAWPKNGSEWLGHLLVTTAGLVGQFALTKGLSRAGAARATAVTMAGPVFGLAADWLIFGAIPAIGSLIATVIVMTALLLLAWGRPKVPNAVAAALLLFALSPIAFAQDATSRQVAPRTLRVADLFRLELERVDDPTAWREALASPLDPDLLVQGVTGLGRVGHPDLVVVLSELLDGRPDPWPKSLKRASGVAAGLLADEALIVRLLPHLDEDDIARALGLLGRWPIDALRRSAVERALAARDPAPLGSEIELDADRVDDPISARLMRLTAFPDPVGDSIALAILAGDSDVLRLRAALFRLARGQKAPASAAPLIEDYLDHLDGEVAGLAARALARSVDVSDRAIASIAAMLALGGDRIATLDRIAALGGLGRASGIPVLFAHAGASDPQMRRAAIEGLVAGNGPFPPQFLSAGVNLVLRIAREDPVVDVRRAALLTLGKLDPVRLRSSVATWITSPSAVLRSALAGAMTYGPWDDALGALLLDSDRRVGTALLEAITARIESGRLPLSDEAARLESWIGLPDTAPTGSHSGDSVRRAVEGQLAMAWRKAGGAKSVTAKWIRTRAVDISPMDMEPLQVFLDLATLIPSPEHGVWIEPLIAHPVADIRDRAVKAMRALGVEVVVPRRSLATIPAFTLPWVEIARDLERPVVQLWEVETDRGSFTLHLDTRAAPVTVWRLNSMARQGEFDGRTFHRVVPAFVVQGGCPRGDGWGGPGFVVRCEVSDLTYSKGTVGMALAGKDTGGCQWFVTHRATPHLDLRYTIFGCVVEGMDVIEQILPDDKIIKITPRTLP